MMGGGGSMQSMNTTIKNNRLMSKRRKDRVKKVQEVFRESVAREKAFLGKEISQEKLNQIKQKIRKEAQRRRVIYYIVRVSTIVLFVGFFIGLILIIR